MVTNLFSKAKYAKTKDVTQLNSQITINKFSKLKFLYNIHKIQALRKLTLVNKHHLSGAIQSLHHQLLQLKVFQPIQDAIGLRVQDFAKL